MRHTNWHLCAGGYHFWPEPFKHRAERCCFELNEVLHAALTLFVPDYLCTSGKHRWAKSEDALCCCDGHLPVWKPMNTPFMVQCPIQILNRVLIPVAEVANMDALASAPGDQPQLYWPM